MISLFNISALRVNQDFSFYLFCSPIAKLVFRDQPPEEYCNGHNVVV